MQPFPSINQPATPKLSTSSLTDQDIQLCPESKTSTKFRLPLKASIMDYIAVRDTAVKDAFLSLIKEAKPELSEGMSMPFCHLYPPID